jgi:hypothetical protein
VLCAAAVPGPELARPEPTSPELINLDSTARAPQRDRQASTESTA